MKKSKHNDHCKNAYDGEGLYRGFSIHGHADGYEKDGEYDLICAAVSAITLTTAGGLEDVLHREGTYDSDFGFMHVEISTPEDEKSQVLFQTMVHGLRAVETRYPRHLKILDIKG